MTIFWLFLQHLLLCLLTTIKTSVGDVADPLECPSGTLAYGMTLFIPESVYWRDPDLGPPPISNAPMPVSVCLLCGRITEIHREGNREFETLSPTSTEIRNLPSYQVCIGKGDLSRTVTQTFDCTDKSYLRHFNKDYKNMNTTYECAKVDNWEKADSYEASFNVEKANSRSRANWRDLTTNLTCETDYFMCGLEIFLDGIFDDHDEHETLDMKSEKFTELEEEEHHIIKPHRGPQFRAKCCNIERTDSTFSKGNSSSLSEKYVVSNEVLPSTHKHSRRQDITIIILSILVAVLMLTLFICMANLLCCHCVKQGSNFTSKAMVDCDSSMGNSNDDKDTYRDDISTTPDDHEETGRRSVFNSRPPTGFKKNSNGTVSILHVTPPRD